jgi:outer membrane protein assembly factor BamA
MAALRRRLAVLIIPVMRPWATIPLLVFLLVGAATAQAPPCFRSKFAAEQPIKVKKVELRDDNRLSKREKAFIVRELRRECDCWPCALTEEVGEQLREMYQWFGFYQAVAQVAIHKRGVDSYSIMARVQEGPQYRLGDISFSRVKAFPEPQLRKLFPLLPGAPFDTRQVRRGLENLRQLYGSRGYINFSAVPETSVDSATKSITLRIDVDEGSVFRVGSLQLSNIEVRRGLGKQLLDAWRPHMGEIYSAEFVDRFLDENIIPGMQARPQVTYIQDPKGVVSVRMDFAAKEPGGS